MSKQIYWGVMRKTKGRRVWPQRFHFRAQDAKSEMHRWNQYDGNPLRKKNFVVVRFLLETKDAVHYDVYKHEVKRI